MLEAPLTFLLLFSEKLAADCWITLGPESNKEKGKGIRAINLLYFNARKTYTLDTVISSLTIFFREILCK